MNAHSIMNEITNENFNKVYPHLVATLKNANFIAIDGEFTGIAADDVKNRLVSALFGAFGLVSLCIFMNVSCLSSACSIRRRIATRSKRLLFNRMQLFNLASARFNMYQIRMSTERKPSTSFCYLGPHRWRSDSSSGKSERWNSWQRMNSILTKYIAFFRLSDEN